MKENRREFLIKSGCALGMTALATQMRHFGLMSAIAQNVSDETQNLVPSDYRALVCVFLSGGNDGNNMVIPNHNDATLSNYTTYFNARNPQSLAVPQFPDQSCRCRSRVRPDRARTRRGHALPARSATRVVAPHRRSRT